MEMMDHLMAEKLMKNNEDSQMGQVTHTQKNTNPYFVLRGALNYSKWSAHREKLGNHCSTAITVGQLFNA